MVATPKIALMTENGKNDIAPATIPTIAIVPAAIRKPSRVCDGVDVACVAGCEPDIADGGEYGLSSRSFKVGRLTEDFYDTVLNEANDA